MWWLDLWKNKTRKWFGDYDIIQILQLLHVLLWLTNKQQVPELNQCGVKKRIWPQTYYAKCNWYVQLQQFCKNMTN